MDTATSGLAVEGLAVSSGATPAIWQVLTGRVELRVEVDSAAVATMASCRLDSAVDVRIDPTALYLGVQMQRQDGTIPATIRFQPERTAEGWRLVPGTVNVAGFDIPPALLGRAGNAVPAALIDGVELPSDSAGIAVTSVSLAQDELVITLTAPTSASTARTIAGPMSGCTD